MTGEPSVSPYAMVISDACISAITRFMISMGQGEPAMMPVRRLDRSNIGNIGWFSSAMNIVGTPYSAVHFSFCTEARTRSGIEAFHEDRRCPVGDDGHDAQHQAEAVEERHREADALVRRRTSAVHRYGSRC